MSTDPLSELQQTLAGARSILAAQTRLIDLCLHRLKEIRDGMAPLPNGANRRVLEVVLTMIHVSGVSSHSILKLTDEMNLQARDGYPIARSIVETVINIAFIMAGGEAVAEQADRHAQQKAFRDLKRTSSIAGYTVSVGWTGKLTSEDEARLSALVAEFTTKSGRERHDWTESNLEHRLAAIDKRFGHRVMTLIHPAFLMIYRHASEILHGTYFGALFFWGVTTPGQRPSTADELKIVLGHHQLAVAMSVILANTALIDCVGQYFDYFEVSAFSDDLLRQLEKLPLIKNGLASQPPSGQV